MEQRSIVNILLEVNENSNLNETNVVQEIKNAFISAIKNEEKINKTEREAIETAYQGWTKGGCKIDHLFEFDQDNDPSHANYKQALLHIAAMGGFTKVIDALIGNDANIEVVTEQIGWTPLYIASVVGEVEVVDLLATKGANVNIVCKLKFPILFLAASEGDIKTVECLLKYGANVDILNQDNMTSLHIAAKNGYTAIVQLLLKKGATVDAQNSDGKTPLHLAAEKGNVDIVCALIEKGAKVDTLGGRYKSTPLHFAAENGHERMVEFLLNKGADVNAQNACRETPLHFAALKGYTNIIQSLIVRGADVSLKEARGLTPLDYKDVDSALLKQAEKKAQQPIKYAIILGIAGGVVCGLSIGAMLLNDSPEAAGAFAAVVSGVVLAVACGVMLYMCLSLKPDTKKGPVIKKHNEINDPKTNMVEIDPEGKGKEGTVVNGSAALEPAMQHS